VPESERETTGNILRRAWVASTHVGSRPPISPTKDEALEDPRAESARLCAALQNGGMTQKETRATILAIRRIAKILSPRGGRLRG
jgi:hypothetical protein